MKSSTQHSVISSQLVRVQQKPIDQLPEWALCCQPMREAFERQQAEPIQALVIPTIIIGESHCKSCGRIVSDLGFMEVARELRGGWNPIPAGARRVIAVDCFEFDEGPAEDRA
jgi:hypothetical protein